MPGQARETHEEVKAIPVVNKYKGTGPHSSNGSQEGKEEHSLSKGVEISGMLGEMRRDW